MLIAQLEPPHCTREGDWYYRTYSPGHALAQHAGVWVVDLTNNHRRREVVFGTADVLVLNMVCDPDLFPIIAGRRRAGQVTVFEVNDDITHFQPWNPAAGFFANPDNQLLFRALVQSCDAVQFSTTELKRVYGHLNACQRVFHNEIAKPLLPRRTLARDRVVVGWGGSAGHYGDMARIAPALLDWMRGRTNVELHLMCGDRIRKLFQTLPKKQRKHRAPGSIDQYYEFVASLDIGFAPLEDTGFNRSRSDVKFLEYSLGGAASVLQDLAPYRDTVPEHTALFFGTPEQLIAALERLVNHPEERSELVTHALAYLTGERSESVHSQSRLEFYRDLVSRGARPTPAPGEESRVLSELAQNEAAELEGRHLLLGSGRYEKLIHDALVLIQRRDPRALRLLEEAQKLEPSNYQPWLYAASLAPEPTELLQKALLRNADSIYVRLMLASELGAQNLQAALAELLAVTRLCPSYPVPYRRAAELLETAGLLSEAREFQGISQKLERSGSAVAVAQNP